MTAPPINLALIFGGRSPEHDVSLMSARGIAANLDRGRFRVLLVGIDRSGVPRLGGDELLDGGLERGAGTAVRWPASPVDTTLREETTGRTVSPPIDAAFVIVHGPGGEDGTLQGVLQLAGIPCVGPGVLGSALAMDKDRARRILAAAGLPVVRDAVFEGAALDDIAAVVELTTDLHWPIFVKPARAGSSVGISRVESAAELAPALAAAREIDTKVVIEEAIIQAREIEVAVLGNRDARASVPGEIVPRRRFYDYAAKYADDTSELLVPAPVDAALTARLQRLALDAFHALDLTGMARVDFLLSRSNGALVVSEVNTLPGFTPISMYPRLWEATGVPYSQLLTRLVDCAIEAAAWGPLRNPRALRDPDSPRSPSAPRRR